jgi:hypothetical protein
MNLCTEGSWMIPPRGLHCGATWNLSPTGACNHTALPKAVAEVEDRSDILAVASRFVRAGGGQGVNARGDRRP